MSKASKAQKDHCASILKGNDDYIPFHYVEAIQKRFKYWHIPNTFTDEQIRRFRRGQFFDLDIANAFEKEIELIKNRLNPK
ncbi:MAG: hypothetical protein HRT72_03915 [Flavobacteriales bacterium]|nr:hypothetical protein [Flavobacteriales bacterium]